MATYENPYTGGYEKAYQGICKALNSPHGAGYRSSWQLGPMPDC